MHRTLIAGGGDLGQRVATALLAQGVDVHALRRRVPHTGPAGLHWHAADLTQPASLAGLPTDVDSMFYILTPGARDAAAYRAVFIDGLDRLLDQVGHPDLRVFFVSSTAVYGEHHGDWVDESTPCQPLGHNGRILLEAEHRLRARQPHATVLRLAGLYGSGSSFLFDRLRAGQAAAPRHPVHWANRIHRDDAAAALVHLWRLPQAEPLYLGCDDTPLPLHELYQYLAELIGAPPVAEGPAPALVGSKRLSNARLKASGLNWQWPDSRAGYRAQWEALQRS